MRVHYRQLYKRTATGAIQVWWQERDGHRYRTHSGQKGGQIVTSEWTSAKPKNEGRANATTPQQQAENEIESNYRLKKKGGYHETVDAVDAERFSPMLAKSYDDYKDEVLAALDVGGMYYVQPKLDGIRCIARADGLWSRQGNRIVGVPHIEAALAPMFEHNPDFILDGELYCHELKDDFPSLVSLIKKQKPTPEDLEASRVVEYWIYDAPSDDHMLGRLHRVVSVVAVVHATVGPAAPVVVVPTHDILHPDDLDDFHNKWLSEGFEGTMIRSANAPYEQKRSKTLLKRKEWMDEEFEVLAIEEGEGNRSGMAGNVVVRLPSGTEGSANVKGSREYCRKILEMRDDLVGKKVTVEFFGYTPDGKLRFGRTKLFHTEERW